MIKFLGYVVVVAALAFLRVYTIQCNWDWFVTPFGLMSLTMPHAFGLAGFISFLTFHQAKDTNPDKMEETICESLWVGGLLSLSTLFFGWLFHSFMVQ